MAPRKRPAPARKSTTQSNNNQPSQPAKFGIQHFFERHLLSSQAASQADKPNDPSTSKAETPGEDLVHKTELIESTALTEISPDGSKRAPPKRFKFSPGMIIKQSQDEGGEAVTWKVSPVNERLRSLASKTVPKTTRVFAEASRRTNSSTIKPCSDTETQSYSMGKLKSWISSKPESEVQNSVGNLTKCDNNNLNNKSEESPFKTPPSLSYNSIALKEGLNAGTDQPIIQEHQKNLMELLDQVKDAIIEENEDESILRLLNEQSGNERALYLCDDWFYSLVGPGDTVNVIGEFNEKGKCIVNRAENLVILHPDILLSGTRVASSFTCSRRAVLDERLKNSENSIHALIGILLHQIFQAGLVKKFPSVNFLEERAKEILKKNLESLYACGASEKDVLSTLTETIPRMLNWFDCFMKDSQNVTVDFGQYEGPKDLSVNEILDIEEMAWAPRYGLKGVIDASVKIRIKSNKNNEKSSHEIIPLEFKTGKSTTGQSATEHAAQVILYTLLMSERYLKKDIDLGLLYYLHTNQTLGIKVQRSDLVGLIMRRNELASEILKALTSQTLPPMIQSQAMCRNCRHLNTCTVYHKANGGDTASSGLGNIFDNLINHLTISHYNFLKHWEKLIDLEAQTTQVLKKEIFRPSLKGEKKSGSISPLFLDSRTEISVESTSKNERYLYKFERQKEEIEIEDSSTNNIESTLRSSDCVVLSTESGRIAVANGVIRDINRLHVQVSFSRRLRLPGSDSSSEQEILSQQIWRIDKDEFSSSYNIMRSNLVQLFVQNSRSSQLRKLIVDLEAPRFESGGLLSQDPAISYVRSEKSLNDDQRRSIHKILAARDYALILGMPGTGKTHTMAHAVKSLLIRGSTVLLTSYTNSAVDNLLLKLKSQNIDFIRIGRDEAVHDEIKDHCFSAMDAKSLNEIKHRMESVKVVGVTCFGINHPLLTNKKFDVCICDEAGQITLPVSLGPLMLASKFVLVGDHYQLPPLVQSTEARENGMGVSLFWRLSEAHPHAISALQCQYRMCEGIMELSNALIYSHRLRCGSYEIANSKLSFSRNNSNSTQSWLDEILDPDKPTIFVNTDNLSAFEQRENKAVNNPVEVFIISQATDELINRGIKPDEICVITPYNSQASLIKRSINSSVEVQTIDKYQGRDKDCVVVSFVRSTAGDSKACSSTLLGDWHRINVVLTRAKKKLIMVGSCRTLCGVPLLRLLIEKVEESDGVVHLSKENIRLSDQNDVDI
ncbi:hypothetical protein LUZ60_016924 [Juncus effusus]|nr:hypothetical protein LUZ60_016924 [Juncus effusus]